MVFKRDRSGQIKEVKEPRKIRPASEPKSEHGKIMQERSDAKLREMIRALDERERKIVLDALSE